MESTSVTVNQDDRAAPAPTQATTAKRPNQVSSQPKTFNKKSKKSKNNGQSSATSTDGKRTSATFEKQKETSTIFTTALLICFEIETSFIGSLRVSRILFEILQSRDRKLTELFTLHQLQYVTLLTTILRSATTSVRTGTTIIHGLSRLRDSVGNIILPEVLCKYIETIGKTETPMSISIVPYIRNYQDMIRHSNFIDPLTLLTDEEREYADDEWGINDRVILQVTQGLSRALKGVLQLRSITTEIAGKDEFLSSGTLLPNGFVEPRSPFKMDVNTCTLGACFGFREDDVERGLSLTNVHVAQSVFMEGYLTTWILRQFMQNNH